MGILKYTQSHHDFRKGVRLFLEKHASPSKSRWDKAQLIPKTFWQKMGGRGFLCMSVSPKYNGQGKDFFHTVILIEEIARINYMALFAYLHSDVVVPYIEAYACEELKQKYLPGCVSGHIITAVAMSEPGAGSDLSAMATTAQEEGDQVVLNGSKTFISNGVNCDLVVLAARNPDQADPHKAISLYLVEAGTPGFKKGRAFEKMGMHSQDTTELFFSNCRIPKKNQLGRQGQGFLMLMEKLQQERLVCAIGGISSAKFILDYTLEYCTKINPAKKFQAAQFAFAEMATQVKLGKTFVDHLIVKHMENRQIAVETSMAKYWTSDLVKQLGDRCLDLLGDFGTMEDCPVAEAYKDLRVLSIFAGTNEIMKGIIAKSMGL